VLKQWLEAGHLAGSAVDLVLGQHPPGGVLHGCQQVDLAAVTPGAAERLAVHRDGPSPSVGAIPVGQPRADHPGQGLSIQAAQDATDGGLGWDGPVVGRIAAGAERGPDRLWGIRGPLGDRGHRPGAGQHRGGHGQDGDQPMAAATATSWVADRREVGQQVRGFGFLERLGILELGQGRWDRG
jgi:hypothetical protein